MTATRQEWRDGWTLVLAASLGMGLTAAPMYTLGLFFAPLEKQFGWSHSDMASAVSITSVVTGLASPFVGRLIDRFGARTIALIGTVVTCAGIAALSALTSSIVSYWGIWGLISIGFVFGAPLSWTFAVATRFSHTRGLALSITLCGTNVIGAIAPPLMTLLLEHHSWRFAWQVLAASMFLCVFPVALAFFYDASELARKRMGQPVAAEPNRTPSGSKEGMSFRRALRTRNFWLMVISFLFGAAGLVGFIAHFIPMQIHNGLSPLAAAGAASMLSLAAVIGRLIGGYLMDRVFAPRIAAVVFAFPILACLALTQIAGSVFLGFASGALIGVALGAEYNLLAYLSSRYFGFRQYGIIYGCIFGAFTFGQAIMPPVVGALYDHSGNYQMALVLLGLCFLTSAVVMQFCGPYPRWTGASR